MVASTLDTPEFFSRARNLIRKLGHVWNDDPRISDGYYEGRLILQL